MPLGKWDVSSVTDMGEMFYGAKTFNQSLAEWNTSGVMDMYGMFWEAESFIQSIDSWNPGDPDGTRNAFMYPY